VGMGANGPRGAVCAGGQQAGCCAWRCCPSGDGEGPTPSLIVALGSGQRVEALICGDGRERTAQGA
jgi:hypothetical protein